MLVAPQGINFIIAYFSAQTANCNTCLNVTFYSKIKLISSYIYPFYVIAARVYHLIGAANFTCSEIMKFFSCIAHLYVAWLKNMYSEIVLLDSLMSYGGKK